MFNLGKKIPVGERELLKQREENQKELQKTLTHLQDLANKIVEEIYRPEHLTYANVLDLHKMTEEQIKLNCFRMDVNYIFNVAKPDKADDQGK